MTASRYDDPPPREIPTNQTNTTTHFLREARALHAIVDLVATPNTEAGRDTVVWCVGCSTGDEPYGLAMLAREAGADISILATDVNSDALGVAQRARYPLRNLRHVDDTRRARWFWRDGSHWMVSGEVRDRVKFREHDVVREAAPRHDVDVAICRNVMVHFSPSEVRAALATIVASLRPGSLLVLSAAEWLRAELRGPLVPIEKGGLVVYQRVDNGLAIPKLEPAPLPVVLAPRASTAIPAPIRREPDPDDDLAALRRSGDALLDAGRPHEARAAFARAIEKAPLLGDLHLRVALCHLHAHESDLARTALRSALFLAPKLWPAWVLMADLASEPTYARHCLDQARAALGDTRDLRDTRLGDLERLVTSAGRKDS